MKFRRGALRLLLPLALGACANDARRPVGWSALTHGANAPNYDVLFATDVVHSLEIAELFLAGNDPLRVMKWRDILDNLESATDRCEDVTNILEGVVLEYA